MSRPPGDAGAAQPVCCGASCADLKYDDNNCGGCGSYCGDSGYTDCVNGSCIQVPN